MTVCSKRARSLAESMVVPRARVPLGRAVGGDAIIVTWAMGQVHMGDLSEARFIPADLAERAAGLWSSRRLFGFPIPKGGLPDAAARSGAEAFDGFGLRFRSSP